MLKFLKNLFCKTYENSNKIKVPNELISAIQSVKNKNIKGETFEIYYDTLSIIKSPYIIKIFPLTLFNFYSFIHCTHISVDIVDKNNKLINIYSYCGWDIDDKTLIAEFRNKIESILIETANEINKTNQEIKDSIIKTIKEIL